MSVKKMNPALYFLTLAAIILSVCLSFDSVVSAQAEKNIIIVPERETIYLDCGRVFEEELTFDHSRQVISFRVQAPPESELLVTVRDSGQVGDVWEGCIKEEGRRKELSNLLEMIEIGSCTRNRKNFSYSPPAVRFLPEGRGLVTVRLIEPIGIFPAHMYLRMELSCEGPEPQDPREVAERVIVEELAGETEDKSVFVYPEPLTRGEAVDNWNGEPIYVPQQDVWYVFVDDMAGANFEHPTRHVFVDVETGGIARVLPATTPPKEIFGRMEHVAGVRPNLSTLTHPASAEESYSLSQLSSEDTVFANESSSSLPYAGLEEVDQGGVTTDSGQSEPILVASGKGLDIDLWTDKSTYQVGERGTIYYSIDRPARVQLTVEKPDGTAVKFGPSLVSAGEHARSGEMGEPLGRRKVILDVWSDSERRQMHTYFSVVSSDEGGDYGNQMKPSPPSPPSPPAVPGGPPESEEPPAQEKAQPNAPSFQEKNKLQLLARGLYVYYQGSYTTVGQTTMGGHLPVYVDMPSGGLLWTFEYYHDTSSWKSKMWLTSGGWKKLWFTGDVGGWHSIIANVNGSWTNWIHIYVSSWGPPPPPPQDRCSVSPTNLDLGTVFVGSSRTGSFTVKNTGTTTISGSVSESCSSFSVSPSYYTLAPGASRTFTARFSPISSGNKSCRVRLSSPCSDVYLSGVGRALAPVKRKYAVLISGGVDAANNYSRYLNDISEIHSALKNKYSYSESDIYVLYADGGGPSWVDHSALKSNVQTVFNQLRTKMNSNDELFVYVTNHGGQRVSGTNQAKIWLWNYESIADWEFANLVNPIPADKKYFVFEQCYSGGMIDDLAGTDKVIATAAHWSEVSYACDGSGDYGVCPSYNYDEFVLHWTAAVYGRSPSGSYVNADSDGNGKVEMDEAFNYARSRDSQSERPQYSDPSGVGRSSTL